MIDRHGLLRCIVTHEFSDGDLDTLRRVMTVQGTESSDAGTTQVGVTGINLENATNFSYSRNRWASERDSETGFAGVASNRWTGL
jgi:hypothetical protein